MSCVCPETQCLWTRSTPTTIQSGQDAECGSSSLDQLPWEDVSAVPGNFKLQMRAYLSQFFTNCASFERRLILLSRVYTASNMPDRLRHVTFRNFTQSPHWSNWPGRSSNSTAGMIGSNVPIGGRSQSTSRGRRACGYPLPPVVDSDDISSSIASGLQHTNEQIHILRIAKKLPVQSTTNKCRNFTKCRSVER